MKEEKNLDRLFQEKFKDFEKHPSDAVWKNIVAARDSKEDRKIIPLWWKLGGAAAVVALLFTTAVVLFNNTPQKTTDNPIVESINENNTDTTNSTNTIQDRLVTEEVPQNNKESEIASNSTDNEIDNDDLLKTKGNTARSQNTQAPYTKNTTQGSLVTTASNNNTSVNYTTPSNTSADKLTSNSDQSLERTRFSNDKERNEILERELNANTGLSQVAQNNKETTLENTDKKISLIDEAKRIEEEKDTSEAVAVLEETAVTNRWDVGAVAAPVYYGDFGGSGIDPAFSDNTKSGDVNFSYGVQLSYAVSPKLKVRTGVSNVDLSYNTGGIEFNASADARRLAGINFNENARALNIVDAGSSSQNAVQNELSNEGIDTQKTVDGSLQQRIGFVEIPVEAVYVVSDKRLGVQVVGGVSTLFLNNNEVILNSIDGLQSNLGSANGVNDLSFTTNIGLGLDYKMTDKLKLNVEPSLKYQLNAFDESVGDFKPYFVGLYTGVSYRF